MSNKFNQKKQKLLARKEQLLKDLKYYEVRIEEAKRASENCWVYDDDSSDSEIEFSVKAGVSLTELRLQQSQLHTCLQATQELTGLSVLQSEVNILVNAPTFEGEPPVLEAGCWREVMAECKIDLVSFSMSFYQHQPSRQFAQSQYRALRVLPIKLVHEKELSQSVLVEQRVPSDAVEVLRSYAQAHRSRRDSLAALAERFADALYMEAAPEGGYVLRCAELLRVTWSLQNRRSALAPFLHKMAFDLEYMDESYIKTISQAHKQLCDPALDTDHRTLLLAQIIDTCLAARRLAGPLTDSDVDSQHSRRQTSDLEMDVPTTSGLMGPPTSLPKKSKRKGKENNTPTTSDRKRGNDTEGDREVPSKKAKNDADLPNSKDNKDDNAKISNVKKSSSKNSDIEATNKVHRKETKNTDISNKKAKLKDSNVKKNVDLQSKRDSVKTKQDAKLSNVEDNEIWDNLNTVKNKAPENKKATQNKQKNVASKSKPNDKQANILQDELVMEENVDNAATLKTKTVAKNTKTANENDRKLKKSKAVIPDINKNEQGSSKNKALDENNPKTKKSKIAISEIDKNDKANSENNNTDKDAKTKKSKTAMPENNKNLQENTENVSKKIVNKDSTETKNKEKGKSIQKNDKISKKYNNENITQNVEQMKNKPKTDNTTDTVQKQSEKSEINQKQKSNANNKNQNRVSSTKSCKTDSEKQNTSRESIQTLSERFAPRNRRETFTIDKTNNIHNFITSGKQTNNEIIPKTQPTNNENNAKPIKNAINKNAMKTKSNIKNINMNKNNALKESNINKIKSTDSELNKINIKNQNNVKSDNKTHKTNIKDKVNKQIVRQSPRNENVRNIINKVHSKIPQKNLFVAKPMKNPLRISPRKHLLKLSSTRDSSKSSIISVHKQTNIPRLLKKPPVK